ncbi:MAG: polyhydroxyalkanoate synthesis regulator DNA-binding domain-containing protein [Rhodospirillales bacterium]
MDTETVVIKKYENRRLYDTVNSRYINLDDVARMIRRGIDVQVIDARTGDDITRLILTQIIVEDVKEREFALPTDILRQLVLASGEASRESVATYWKAVSEVYQNALDAFARGVFRGREEEGAEAAELEELRRRVEDLERRLSEKRRARTRSKASQSK